jgi:hypothetical protein
MPVVVMKAGKKTLAKWWEVHTGRNHPEAAHVHAAHVHVGGEHSK